MAIELSPSLEHYLKEVFLLQRECRFARVRDLAERLRVAKSAVTAALHSLADKGLVDYRPYDPVTLTSAGEDRAEAIMLRYRVMINFLERVLGLDARRADTAACAMEHALDPVSLERLICFLAFVGRRREGGDSWSGEFRDFLEHGAGDRTCRECIDDFLADMQEAKAPAGGRRRGAAGAVLAGLLCCAAPAVTAVEAGTPDGGEGNGAATEQAADPQPPASLAELREGIVTGRLPDGVWLTDALERFQTATADLPAERLRLADAIVAAVTEQGVDRHEFLEHIPFLAVFGAHDQLTTLLLYDPGPDDYWLECCFYQSILDELYECGTPADARRLREESPEQVKDVFVDLADAIDARVAEAATDGNDGGAEETEPDDGAANP